jgi:hypothetical protein
MTTTVSGPGTRADVRARSLPPSALAPPRPGPGGRRHVAPGRPGRPTSGPHRTPLAWLPWVLLVGLLGLLALVLLLGRLAGSDAGRSAGLLEADDQDLLSAATISDHTGDAVDGRRVLVESVVADVGLWVGSGPDSRVLVVLAPEARRTAGQSGLRITAGSRLDLTGEVARLDTAPSALGVSAEEGAQQLQSQNAYVRATQVRLAA